MNSLLPLNKDLDALTIDEILKEFTKENRQFGRIQFYPVFASRYDFFRDILVDEISDLNQRRNEAYGNIRMAWVAVISILVHAPKEKDKKEILKVIKEVWTENEYEELRTYLIEDEELGRYFN